MKFLLQDPVRVRPLDLSADILSMLVSGAAKALILPSSVLGQMVAGDLWWVREGIIVDTQTRRDRLRFRYAGQPGRFVVNWPAALAAPSAGPRPRESMPLVCSRASLVVGGIRVMRLTQDVTPESAFDLGLGLNGGGWGLPIYPAPFVPQPTPAEAVLTMFEWQHGGSVPKWSGSVLQVDVRCIARNARDLVPGLGSGGAR